MYMNVCIIFICTRIYIEREGGRRERTWGLVAEFCELEGEEVIDAIIVVLDLRIGSCKRVCDEVHLLHCFGLMRLEYFGF